MADLEFIDKSLDKLLELLEQSTRFIDRETQFHNMIETEEAFDKLLKAFLNEDSTFIKTNSAEASLFKGKVMQISGNAANRKTHLEDETLALAGNSVQEPVVSPMELSELLKGIS
jgi:hypothetical protein